MNIVFISNFLNHHQLPLCLSFCKQPNVSFTFIATMEIPQEQLKLGYTDMNKLYDFVLCTYEKKDRQAKKLCKECDVLIIGGSDKSEWYVRGRNREKKVTFYYSERLFKEEHLNWKSVGRFLKYLIRGIHYQNSYLLCCGAYVAYDYLKVGCFKERAYKWGYFPEVKNHNMEALMHQKNSKTITILWTARFLHWKHPEAAIALAKKLKGNGYSFVIQIIGKGSLEDELHKLVYENNLQDCVIMLGAMPQQKVREYMEKTNIFILTSDQNEGWGAVLNESMSSACAVVASNAVGSASFLIEDNINGLLFKNKDWNDLYEKVKRLIDEPELKECFGRMAYQTMMEKWNAEIAAKRLVELSEHLERCEQTPFITGPCSKAEVLSKQYL